MLGTVILATIGVGCLLVSERHTVMTVLRRGGMSNWLCLLGSCCFGAAMIYNIVCSWNKE